jgi:hypothetical protein
MRYYDDTASPRGSRVYGFNPEYGTAVLPTAECLREVLQEKDLWPINREAWAYRDGNNFYKSVTVHDDLVKCYGEATSLEDYCRRSQALDYHATRAIWEVWNRVRNEKGTGVLYWYNNVPLPKVVAYGWDYSLEPTPALFATQNALEPLHAQYDYLDDMVCLANDLTEPRAVEVAAAVYDFESRKVWEKSAPVTVPAPAGSTARSTSKVGRGSASKRASSSMSAVTAKVWVASSLTSLAPSNQPTKRWSLWAWAPRVHVSPFVKVPPPVAVPPDVARTETMWVTGGSASNTATSVRSPVTLNG